MGVLWAWGGWGVPPCLLLPPLRLSPQAGPGPEAVLGWGRGVASGRASSSLLSSPRSCVLRWHPGSARTGEAPAVVSVSSRAAHPYSALLVSARHGGPLGPFWRDPLAPLALGRGPQLWLSPVPGIPAPQGQGQARLGRPMVVEGRGGPPRRGRGFPPTQGASRIEWRRDAVALVPRDRW